MVLEMPVILEIAMVMVKPQMSIIVHVIPTQTKQMRMMMDKVINVILTPIPMEIILLMQMITALLQPILHKPILIAIVLGMHARILILIWF
jgi:hypothetical protein